MFNNIISLSWIIIFFASPTWSSPIPQGPQPHFQFNTTTHNIHNSNGSSSSIAELVQRQTEAVKSIVSNHQANANGNHHHHHQQQPPKPTAQPEKFTLEELKIKCQHLSRLAASANNTKSTTQTPPQNTQKVRPTGGFYITTKPTITSRKPTSTSTPPPSRKPSSAQNVKFIKLEPVILQKTVLNDGRTIYYWLRSLPSAVQINPNLPTTTTPQPTTTPSTTTSTTTAQSGLNFRNFFPSFYQIGSAEPPSSTTTEKTTTTPTTDPTPSDIDKNNELVYKQQLKFVVPVPYSSANDENVKKPWELDPFAYYPKPLQPETINLQVPYVPTFHVIKAVALPDEYNIPQSDEYPPSDLTNVQID